MNTRFGPFELETGGRRLTRRGVDVHLTPKAFDLLVALVSGRPDALSKTALHAVLWPETFVAESNLPALVNEVRRALSDNASRPRFIRTVPRFGYAFCGEVINGPNDRDTATASCWLILDTVRIELGRGENVVGRDPRSEAWIDLPTVSRRHARITIEGDEVRLEDLRSKNGTCLHGRRIDGPTLLRDRDMILFGTVPVTFRAWQAHRHAETQTSDT